MKFVIGNWKMKLSERESIALAEAVTRSWAAQQAETEDVQVVLCPSHLAIADVHDVIHGTGIGLGAQDVFWEDKGAYTGEISPATLKELGCKYGIVGHSERRQHLGETDEMVHKKAAALLRHDLHPIVCVGETAEEKDAGKRDAVVIGQVKAALEGLTPVGNQRIVVAYEPRWAIGTGRAASPDDAAAAHHLIRETLYELYANDVVDRQCFVIYGGSADASNVGSFLSVDVIEGVLVGGASLKADEFVKMAETALDVA